MTQPTFLVIGAAKCGTTSVCDLLASHPEVFMATPKEPHYYSRLTTYRDLRPWYYSLFEEAEGYLAIGEGSTSYSHPHRIEFVVPRIRDELPGVRIIYMVRHPVRRLESDWKMRRREDRTSESIAKAVDEQASLVTFGLYWKHLSLYRQALSDEQILVVYLEELAEEPDRVLSEMYRHIGVDPSFVPENPGRQRNAATDYREDGHLASAIRRVPGTSKLKKAVPEWINQFLRSALTDEYDPTPDWNPTALELVNGYFRDDASRLLHYSGKPPDYWSFAG